MKKFIKYIIIASIFLAFVIVGCYSIVSINADGKTFDNVNDIPHRKIGLLLGTSPITPYGGHNYYFDARMKATATLYHAGKIDKIIVSGGDYTHQTNGCNEPIAMRDSLVARGVPEDIIIYDYAGLRTINSIINAKEVYGLDSVTIISQNYHNERAIWIAEHYDLNAIAYDAHTPTILNKRIKNYGREFLARVKMFLDLIVGDKPKSVPKSNATQRCYYTKKDTINNLIVYQPKYKKIDLVCDSMPSKQNKDVIFCCAAAFTGELLDSFKHSNIASDHVSNGIRYKGYKCNRNTGAFVFYNDTFKFVGKDFDQEFNSAAKYNGMGFAQECMIHNGAKVTYTRKDSNKNEFRALCNLNDTLCVIDSNGIIAFGDFVSQLLEIGVTEALYLDMGPGWNYSWWRDSLDNAIDIHHKRIPYTTNWITFYK